MKILGWADAFSRARSGVLIFVAATVCLAQAPPPPQAPPPAQPPPAAQLPPPGQPPPAPPYAQQSPEQLQQLVAPIALYPDPLVAEVLTASTFPEQVVEADRWLQAHPGLAGAPLAQEVDAQPWDASVKGLTAFPAVLGNMDRNLSWTSSLGDAYYNQPQDVMNAVQVMRERAQAAGNLQSTSQQVVSTQDSTISIEPGDPNVVFVPAYDPWVVYGAPIVAWPDWYAYPGIWFGGPYLSFGIGLPIAVFGGFAWGWAHWGFNWHDHAVLFNRRAYYSRSTTFFNRSGFYGAGPGLRGARAQPFAGDTQAARGYAEPRGQMGLSTGAFSGYNRGGEERGFAARGATSFGGGAHFGGGGARGGGGRR